jgi:hypothetical protein
LREEELAGAGARSNRQTPITIILIYLMIS